MENLQLPSAFAVDGRRGKLAGIDMSSPEPIRRALGVFKDTLAQFKAVIMA